MRKICIITGTRAEYGLLSSLMRAIREDKQFELQVIATGMHLSPEFGLTYQEIEKDGFSIDEKVEMLLSSDTTIGITKSTGLAMIGFADALARLQPDLVVVLGDRFETFAASTAAYLSKIPIAHLHGGEVTEGATDEGLRHAITKMAYFHFASTEAYRKRIIQLGESPERVFNVGAIGIDNIKNLSLLSREEIENNLKIKLNIPVFLVTYHPVTLENNSAKVQFVELIAALNSFKEAFVIFTKPNADANGRVIIQLIDEYISKNSHRACAFTSLGQLRYLSLIPYCSAVIGNSSSGIVEVPSFGVPTINIGDRQKGRERAASVIDCGYKQSEIEEAINKAISTDFQDFCRKVDNIYGDGNTTSQIMNIIQNTGEIFLKKPFFDLN